MAAVRGTAGRSGDDSRSQERGASSNNNSKYSNNDSKYNQHFAMVETWIQELTQRLRLSGSEMLFVLSFVGNFVVARVIHYWAQHEEVYNYYNDKRNVFNQWFVKKGWGWTTVAIIVFYALVLTKGKAAVKSRVVSGAVIRYFLATGWWILFTQWCFGLPIMDKVFVWTGGKCTAIDGQRLDAFAGAPSAKGLFTVVTAVVDDAAGNQVSKQVVPTYETAMVTSYACRQLRGVWTGGHDPSGHVFLMVHSSLYLFWETAPYFVSWSQFGSNVRQLWRGLRGPQGAGAVEHVKHFALNNPHIGIVLLVWLWWFMLFMTNMYFHSSAEKSVGLLFGYFGAFAIYYAPRWRK